MTTAETLQPSKSSLQGQYAGFASRFSALMIDLLLVLAVSVIVGFTISLILQFFRLDNALSNLLDNLSQHSDFLGQLIRGLTALGSFSFFFFIYYVTFHTAAAGMTIGKALMGVRVVRMNGQPLILTRCIRRYFAFILAALPFFLGLLWVLVDDRRQGWHDKLSDTCVIYDWPAREDENMLYGLRTRLQYMSEARQRYGIGSDQETAPENLT
ncbi:MAG: RDD family protein [Candidatus Promineifilaceae bacterium]